MNRKGFTLIELLVVIAIIAILAAILFPVFAQVREKARQINCTSNLKQIGLAIIQYQQDYDGYFPGGIDTNWQNAWPSNVQPYVKSIAVFSCPDDTNQSLIAGKQFDGVGVSYASNGYSGWNSVLGENNEFGVMGFSGPNGLWLSNCLKSEAVIPQPSATIMIAEKHNADLIKYGSEGTESFAGGGSIFTGMSWMDEYGPNEIPNGTLSTTAAYPLGPNGAVSVTHGGNQLANFLFIDGHVKAMHPSQTNPNPYANIDSNDGQSNDNMWDAIRQQ